MKKLMRQKNPEYNLCDFDYRFHGSMKRITP